ncbi:hypothetical protein GS575_09490 [Rhodococcus hoagii]|nr:hypothetical protein [Prescottella equi]
MTEHRLRLHMYWLILDWINLATNLPTPARRGAAGRAAPTREYGHPAEWASDTSALIAATLHGWHDALAEHRGETPPPSIATAESVRVAAAWQYLDPRAQALLDYAGDDPADEIRELHNKIRSALGHTRPKQLLPTPCPRDNCGLRTLTRAAGIGQDFVLCEACGYTIQEDAYPDLIRAILDSLIDSAAA